VRNEVSEFPWIDSNVKVPTALSLQGASVVVTGAVGGIGSATCMYLASMGVQIFALDMDEGECAALASSLPSLTTNCHEGIALDISDQISVQNAFRKIKTFTGSLYGLVNAAGIARDALVPMVTSKQWEMTLGVNLIGPIQVAQFASRLMRKSGSGSIVNVASTTGIDGNVGQVAYGSSKAGLINATRTMAMEFAPMGIRVNAVAPGVIDTPMTQGMDEGRLALLAARSHMGRIGQPEEVAAVISWLLSPKSSYVTGQTLRVDGCM